nr:MAG TPA: hypothetical protein [Caudoviricetes sp.]
MLKTCKNCLYGDSNKRKSWYIKTFCFKSRKIVNAIENRENCKYWKRW